MDKLHRKQIIEDRKLGKNDTGPKNRRRKMDFIVSNRVVPGTCSGSKDQIPDNPVIKQLVVVGIRISYM